MCETTISDMHCHLGFFADPMAAARELEAAGVEALCATVTPAEFEHLRELGIEQCSNVHLGVGLHPWWVADGTCGEAEIARAAELAAAEHYVSEIGLDFSHGREEQGEEQIAAFECMLEAVQNGGHVLSIHSVNAAGEVLYLLDKYGTCANNQVIFHWFSGSSYELMRARQLGCYFSVGVRMLETKRGRSYAQQIPPERLLLETDMPASAEDGKEFTTDELIWALQDARDQIAMMRG